MSNLKRFEKLQKDKIFKATVVAFHLMAGAHFIYIFNKIDSLPMDGWFFVFYIVALATYWKLFARIKRKQFEKIKKD